MVEISNGAVNHGHRLHFEAAGDILSTSAEMVKQQMTTRLGEVGAPTLSFFELNLSRTRMIDSVGLNLLVWLIKQVRLRGGKVRVSGADLNILRTLQFTRLDREVEIMNVSRLQ